jgi:hypothetical protein
MRISRGITEAELEHTVTWHFTVDGLHAANDRVVRLMDAWNYRIAPAACRIVSIPPVMDRNSRYASNPCT